MKPLIVYYLEGRWYGSTYEWQRSGSGNYRHVTGLDLPQSKAEIIAFARDNNYAIEWRGLIPEDEPALSSPPNA